METARTRGPRVLIVDDDPETLELEVAPHGLTPQQAAEIGWVIDNPTLRAPCTAGFCQGTTIG
jgi:hypothetical protein